MMKKILLTISALSAALFSTAANAEISQSASTQAVFVDNGGNSLARMGGAFTFGLSTVTDAGVTITAKAGISNSTEATGDNYATTGMSALTFGFASGSFTVADDVTMSDGIGLVGEVTTHAGAGQPTHTNDVKIAYDDGSGIQASTSVGDMTVTGTYIYDGAHTSDIDGGTSTGAGVALSMPVGAGSLTFGTANTETATADNNDTGAALSMPLSSGTLKVGYVQTTGDTAANKGTAYSAAYTTTVAGASVSVGYTTYSAAGKDSTRVDALASASLGGGASLFVEYSNLSGSGVAAAGQDTDESGIAIGTSVSF